MQAPVFRRILILCTANISRSPTAKALLEHELIKRGATGVEVQSAGITSMDGRPADPKMIERLAPHIGAEKTLALAQGHRASKFHEAHARWADLICVMTPEQIQGCQDRFPYLRGRVWLFGGSPSSPEPIEDAFGLSDAVYDEVFQKLVVSAEKWAARLYPASN